MTTLAGAREWIVWVTTCQTAAGWRGDRFAIDDLSCIRTGTSPATFNCMAENYKSMTQDLERDAYAAADTAAEMASKAANRVSDVASQAANRVSDVASEAQRKVTSYLREHDTKAMLKDVESYVKSHPTQALIGAAAFGFLAAALIRRR